MVQQLTAETVSDIIYPDCDGEPMAVPIDNGKKIISLPKLSLKSFPQVTENNLEIYRPDGRRFLTPVELDQLREQERQEKELAQAQAEQERQRAEYEQQRAEEAIAQLEQERQRYQALLEQIHRQSQGG